MAPNFRMPSKQTAVLAAYRKGISIGAIARRTGKPRRTIEWLLTTAGLRVSDRRPPGAAAAGDATEENQPAAFRRQDTAFCRAMKRAIAAGKESPPGIGVHKDARPLAMRQLFEPVPHSSGCGSPAGECADLGSLTQVKIALRTRQR